MYNKESYEEYIRSILGYPNYNVNHFEDNNYCTNDYKNMQVNTELDICYPEIYKIVYPMVSKACSDNIRPITPELVNELTEEIYSSIGAENEIKININLGNVTTNNNTTNNTTNNNNLKRDATRIKKEENRQFSNNGLKDLIKILLIRELLGNRPPRPQIPIRPPFPGTNGPMPPIMPR